MERERLTGQMTPTISKPINWEYYGIYKRFQHVELETMDIAAENANAFEIIKEYARNIVENLNQGLGLRSCWNRKDYGCDCHYERSS